MPKRILVTSALPYVNNEPHLGNIVGCVLSGDVYSRYQKLQGREVLYICGADEYGTCTEVKAREEGVGPREICDRYFEVHKKIYDWFGIDFSHFGRTSTAKPFDDLMWSQTVIAQDIFCKLADNGYLVERESQQLYCPETDSFMADRFVIGTCPNCGYEKAKGDQCDKCCKTYLAVDLKNPRPKLNPNHRLEIRTTNHLYLNLPKLEPQIRTWYQSVREGWTENARSVTDTWLRDGLKERCVTRDLKWGTPVPDTTAFGSRYQGKVMYNWFDAPIGYLAITEQLTEPLGEDWRRWWQTQDEVELVQFFGIDNTIFHSLIFPASLMGTGDSYKLVDKISAVYYLNYDNQKFSKSEGVGVFGSGAMDSGIPADIWRYYLMFQRPEKHDTEFSWADFDAKVNGELSNNLGNLIYRVLSFTHKRFDTKVPQVGELLERDYDFINEINELAANYHTCMDSINLRGGIETVLAISHLCNKYIVDVEPWAIIKVDRQRCATVLHILIHCVSLISSLMNPFMPNTSQMLVNTLNFTYPYDDLKLNILNDQVIDKPKIPFQKVTAEQLEQLKNRFG